MKIDMLEISKVLEKVPPVEIDQPIYCIYNIDTIVHPYKNYIVYGYISSIRQDKDKKWSFLDILIGFQIKTITRFIQKSEIKAKNIRVCMK